MAVAHLALNLGARHQRRHRIDHQHVNRVGAYQRIDNLKRLFAGIGLRHDQFVDIDAQLAGIHRVKRMFGVNKRGRPAAALCLGNDMESERRLAGAFRAINLDHTPARQPAHAKRNVEAERASGNRLHLHRRL